MARLTADVILSQPCRLSPTQDRELDLRGLRVSTIENLAITQDSFDAIDLSDNSIQRLENFPRMSKLRMLLLNNNRISAIERGVADALPNLETLVLTNNKLALLSDLTELLRLRNLSVLMLLGNPVQKRANYRGFVIHSCPHLHLLDGQRVTEAERTEADKWAKSKKGKAYLAEIASEVQGRQSGAAADGTLGAPSVQAVVAPPVLTHAAAHHFQQALAKAATAEQVEALKRAFEEGRLEQYLASEAQAAPPAVDSDSAMPQPEAGQGS